MVPALFSIRNSLTICTKANEISAAAIAIMLTVVVSIILLENRPEGKEWKLLRSSLWAGQSIPVHTCSRRPTLASFVILNFFMKDSIQRNLFTRVYIKLIPIASK